MTYMRAGLPPVIAIHGDADPIVPYEQEVREIDALKKAGGVAELVTIPAGGHGNFPRDQVLRAWTAIDAFLTTNVVNKKPVTTSAAR
jgi:dipeptidyl aminopeptidase/acylaminoacyl peptidase